MSLERKMNNKQLLDALDHIDDRFVAELVTSIKPPETAEGGTMQKKNIIRSIKYAALLAACAVLMGAAIPLASAILGRISLGTGTQSGNPAGSVADGTSALAETEPPATESFETEPAPNPDKLMVEYGWSSKAITNDEADEIIAAYLKKDSDPNKFAYTYSVTCYAKYGSAGKKPVYAVMINSDRWNYEPNDRVEKVFYKPSDPNLHIDFIFPSDQPLLIYTEGKFYTLNEAMQQSILTHIQLMLIRWGDRKGGGFSSFVYPIWLSHSELVEIVYSNPDTTGGWSYRCYGNFDGVYVIFADKKFKVWEPKLTTDIVNGITFVYPNENKLKVCAGGTFYSLSEAFEKNILSAAELAEVHKVYTMESQIEKEFLAKFGHEFPDMVAEDKEVIVKFEKISGDVYVAVIASQCFDNTKSRSETVNGITFTWEQQYDIHVYFHGEFLTLSEAYQRGLLTTEQLIEVHSSYTRSFGEMYGDPTVFQG